MSADEGKRTEMVCTKVTERMFVDLNRAAVMDDRSLSDLLYQLIRRELYGRSVKWADVDGDIQGQTK